MPVSTHGGTAKIYEFPKGGRMAVEAARANSKRLADLASLHVSDAVIGGSWYHEAAIRGDDQTDKR